MQKPLTIKTGTKRQLGVDFPGADRIGYGMAIDPMRISTFPINLSDAVFVGQVRDFQPLLSSDETSVFTELKVDVENVYRDTFSATPLNGTVTILELGGTLRLKTGRIVSSFAPKTETDLEIGHRYLIFATYEPDKRCLGVIKLSEVTSGHARPMARSDISDAENKTTSYASMGEAEFLATAQKVMFSAQRSQSECGSYCRSSLAACFCSVAQQGHHNKPALTRLQMPARRIQISRAS